MFSDDSSVLVVRSQPTDHWVNFGGRWLIAAAMRRLTDPLKCQATVGGGLMMESTSTTNPLSGAGVVIARVDACSGHHT